MRVPWHMLQLKMLYKRYMCPILIAFSRGMRHRGCFGMWKHGVAAAAAALHDQPCPTFGRAAAICGPPLKTNKEQA